MGKVLIIKTSKKRSTLYFDNTLEKSIVTIRHRDTMEQEVMTINPPSGVF